MAYTMMNCLPCDVVTNIVDRGVELKVKDRLKKGWGLIHDEMMWRETHEYSCAHHFCGVNECGCYRRYPGFLLRRVDSGAWLPGAGETREREGENEPEISNAVWFDFEANEMGILNSLIPTQEFVNEWTYLV